MTIDNLREKNFERKFINIFFLISILLCIFHLYLLTNQFPIKYTYTEWLINYEGGFIKRGLTGQIAIQISKFFALDLKYSILVMQITSYLIYFYFFYLLLKKINLNFFWYCLLLSPLLFNYPLFEMEALGRKDIFIISCFLIFCIIKHKSQTSIIFYFFIFFTFSTLIHEITIFYIFHYIYVIYLKVLLLNEKLNFKNIFFISLLTLFLIFLIMYISKFANIEQMVNAYQNELTTTESGSISWLKPSFEQILSSTFNQISPTNIIRYIFIYLIILTPIILFIRNKNNSLKVLNINLILIVSIMLSIPMHLLIYDWGRILYFYFNFLIIIFIFIYKNFENFDKIYLKKKIEQTSNKRKIFIIIFCCFLFYPQITMKDDLSTIPYVKITIKTFKSLIKLTPSKNYFRNLQEKINSNFINKI